LLVCRKFKLSLKSYSNLKGGSLWWLKMLEKNQILSVFAANILSKYYCNECRQCCFSKLMLLWNLWHSFSWSKSFIMCQHLIVYLSHITIVCPIIASKYIPGSHTSFLCQFISYALGCLVVCCKQVGEQIIQICRHMLLALLVRGH